MSSRRLLLATALICALPVLAEDTVPEESTIQLDASPAISAPSDASTVAQGPEPGDPDPDAGGPIRADGLPNLGFDLPPALEDLMERLEDRLRQEPAPTDPDLGLTPATPLRTAGSVDATSEPGQVVDQPAASMAKAAATDAPPADIGSTSEVDALQPMSPAPDDEKDQVTDLQPAEEAPEANRDETAESEPAPPVTEPVMTADPLPESAPAGDAAIWGPPPPDPAANEFGAVPIALLGSEVAPGVRERLHWTTGQSFSGSVMETPVVVVHGQRRGPRLCLTGGVHGDELNGIEVVRRVAYRIEPQSLAGTVIAVPIVNLLGFSRGSRYLPDRRDLNRFFPGSPHGSSASRIANSFFDALVSQCDALVDIHTGSLDRANLPQVRGDLTNPAVLEFTRGFGATAVLHSPGSPGMLRHAASARGIPAVTFEIGGPLRLQPEEIDHGVQAIETLLNKMGMIEQRRRWREPQAVFYESRWVRVDHGGMLFSEVSLGDRVQRGQRLGRVIDPVSNRGADVVASEAGRIIGMALNQLVLPGFAAYNVGIAASEEQVVIDAAQDAEPGDERYLENDQLDDDQRLEEGDRVPDESLDSARRRDGDGGRH